MSFVQDNIYIENYNINLKKKQLLVQINQAFDTLFGHKEKLN